MKKQDIHLQSVEAWRRRRGGFSSTRMTESFIKYPDSSQCEPWMVLRDNGREKTRHKREQQQAARFVACWSSGCESRGRERASGKASLSLWILSILYMLSTREEIHEREEEGWQFYPDHVKWGIYFPSVFPERLLSFDIFNHLLFLMFSECLSCIINVCVCDADSWFGIKTKFCVFQETRDNRHGHVHQLCSLEFRVVIPSSLQDTRRRRRGVFFSLSSLKN